MRNLMLFLLMVLLGINGLLLWQNREVKPNTKISCCEMPGKMDIRTIDFKKSLIPGFLGLVQ